MSSFENQCILSLINYQLFWLNKGFWSISRWSVWKFDENAFYVLFSLVLSVLWFIPTHDKTFISKVILYKYVTFTDWAWHRYMIHIFYLCERLILVTFKSSFRRITLLFMIMQIGGPICIWLFVSMSITNSINFLISQSLAEWLRLYFNEVHST